MITLFSPLQYLDVVVVMTNDSSITRSEGDEDVSLCAMINSPAGGLATGQTIIVKFSITGHVSRTGICKINGYC